MVLNSGKIYDATLSPTCPYDAPVKIIIKAVINTVRITILIIQIPPDGTSLFLVQPLPESFQIIFQVTDMHSLGLELIFKKR